MRLKLFLILIFVTCVILSCKKDTFLDDDQNKYINQNGIDTNRYPISLNGNLAFIDMAGNVALSTVYEYAGQEYFHNKRCRVVEKKETSKEYINHFEPIGEAINTSNSSNDLEPYYGLYPEVYNEKYIELVDTLGNYIGFHEPNFPIFQPYVEIKHLYTPFYGFIEMEIQ